MTEFTGKYRLFVAGGLGDYLTGIARLATIRDENPNAKIHLYGSCYAGSYDIINSFLESYDNCFERWELREFDKDNPLIPYMVTVDPTDRVFRDWLELGSIKIKYPFLTRGNNTELEKSNKNLGIHMITTNGDMDFAHIGGFNPKRYWGREKWIKLIGEFRDKGWKVYAFGARNEDYKIDLKSLGVKNCLGFDIPTSIDLMLNCNLFIGTNSWPFQVTAYAGIPTVVLYFTNLHWAKSHYDDRMPIKTFSNRNTEIHQVLEGIEQLGIQI